ncbi:MAG: hypothetical protein M3126_05170 [Candidatus Eremiobacteraeota bacterium]|nr:hypothetical protein [Candidatus Eremiobacteraeota bacterium]
MPQVQPLLLIGTVAAVGVLHTMVPDHWLPISIYARSAGWSKRRTAYAAAGAGLGHTLSTLALGLVVWLGGVLAAQRYGHLISALSSGALIAFGLWILVAAVRELRANTEHRIDRGGRPSGGMSLMLILGSSPMVEGIPAFFAAGRYGGGLLVVMSVVFAVTTIGTYVALCLASASGLALLRLGRFEPYGEALSGAIVAAIGSVFLLYS